MSSAGNASAAYQHRAPAELVDLSGAGLPMSDQQSGVRGGGSFRREDRGGDSADGRGGGARGTGRGGDGAAAAKGDGRDHFQSVAEVSENGCREARSYYGGSVGRSVPFCLCVCVVLCMCYCCMYSRCAVCI